MVIIAFDLLGMREYSRINPRLRTLDSLYELLAESDIIPDEVTEHCDVELSLASRTLQIVLSAKTESDQEFCQEESIKIASFIDDPREATLRYTPDSMQFATAAVSASVVADGVVSVSDSNIPDDSTMNGGASGLHIFSIHAIMFLASIASAFCTTL